MTLSINNAHLKTKLSVAISSVIMLSVQFFIVMLSVIMPSVTFLCHAENPYADCRSDKCHYAECRNAWYRGAVSHILQNALWIQDWVPGFNEKNAVTSTINIFARVTDINA
jgi:hypothetical protein